jgi:hypothetical protein
LRLRDDNTSFGASDILYVYPVNLPAQSRKLFTLYMPLRGQRQLSVELVDGVGRPLLSQQTRIEALSSGSYLVGVFASDLSLLNVLARFSQTNGDRVAVAHLKLADLPPTPQGWAGLDMLVFNDVDTSQLTSTQQDALNYWVGHGGRLIVGGGPNAEQTIAGLSSLLPFAGVTIQTLSGPLTGSYLTDLDDLSSQTLNNRGPYVAAVPTNPTGNIIAQENGVSFGNDVPLTTSIKRGRGQVYYIAFDLGLAPLDTLAGQPQFFGQFAGQFQPQLGRFVEQAKIDNIRSSLALIPDQTLPSPATVAVYLIVYIVALGPANYYVLGRLKRREWAWYSIPIIILLFSSYGYFSGFRLRGGRPLVRQITVLQAESNASMASLDAFVGVYSPHRADYALEIESQAALVESLPDTFGINNELTVTSGSNTTVIENLRADIGGIPAIMAHSQTIPPQIRASLSHNRANNHLAGHIINDTGQPITDVQLVLQNKALNLGMLPPGETQVDGTTYKLNANGRFYQFANFGENSKETMKLASRDMTVKAVLGLNDNENSPRNLSGLYLVGWQERSPMQVKLVGRGGDKMDDALLVVGLPVVEHD